MKKIVFILLSLAIFSCKKENKETKKVTKTEEISTPETTEEDEIEEPGIVLDWEGSYVGILPCTDCEGKNTEVILNINHTYKKSTLFMKTDKKEEVEEGNFMWLGDGCTIVLDDEERTQLKVTPNTVTVLTAEGEKHKENAEKYILRKNICEEKDYKALPYHGNDGKKYMLTFGEGCEGKFAEIKSDNLSVHLLRETASEKTTTYGNNEDIKLISEKNKATLYLKDKDIELIADH